ncbi:MAG TPA: histone deacetylase family protein [Beijerinckiaceae bacterium]|nr:histone deacetylase family protein [Rhodoblastus sp.]MCC0000076.1 histone deacetylase family protein [Methylobacteriaceae bacterium]HRY03583.1 histone deacetylase family protein [Beijerinckiaceae bacterium]
MSTLFVSHRSSLAHDMGPDHPERPDRVRAIERILENERFQTLLREQAPFGDREAILRAHPEAYIGALERAAPSEGLVQLDGDTAMCPGTMEAAMRAVGGACLAVDEVMERKVANAFVAMRPPGHHAERATPMGFCFFNNAAVAARHAQKVHGAERVAIMDFDVHHGNGTQDIFWSDPTVMYASTHEMPAYPGTGAVSERGEHDNIVNAPLYAGADSDVFRESMEIAILPRIEAFAPDLVIISAGFDAHRLDPLANLKLVEADFAWATRKLMEIAERKAKGRVVSLLEGGYSLEGLSRSAAAHVMTLMGV